MDFLAFVEEQLTPPPVRVLEVGCGRGDLARAMAGRGFDVVAIDPGAPDGEIFRSVSIEDFTDPEPFDAVVANRALHHIADLDGAVAKMARLLRPSGRVAIHEHAWERLDEPTARWYGEQQASEEPGSPPAVERVMREWNEYHHDLHTSAAMRAALERHFEQRHLSWTPYLYGELDPKITEEQERALIDAGAIQATGFCYAGERRVDT